ncbi:cysteine desulfurase family protein [Pararobbsia silviterrae]|uniref:cysteine desulfurase n=1 Tax=Pararobbsia silviterrae TaxID=1792498 RepID=A0A494Y571_9BURK|nr:aminotransferase class V-fold PLP-dependent enzyme [Pararobbsia silviterrae]RKP57791.1 aminotransferase class V-fold PLP-dependent enzyme [Pararobbsia silviterrae]
MRNEHRLRYFDYSATTPVDARVIEAMMQCLGVEGCFGNPASTSHAFGLEARAWVEQARARVASLIGAAPDSIFWTSGATESTNLALKGFAETARGPCRFITSPLEHKATLDTLATLATRGHTVTCIQPSPSGAITASALSDTISDATSLVSLMMVNNELGTLTDIAEIAAIVHSAGAILHVDAAQALGKVPIDVDRLGIDLMSMSAHKLYGPKGIGALYVRPEWIARIAGQIHGGGHEQGLRSGTLATHQIVGMGMACEIAASSMDADARHIETLSQSFLDGLAEIDGITVNARAARRIPNTLSLTVDDPGFLPFMLSGDLAVSSTSACNSASGRPSHVLTGIGLSPEAASRTVRISFGRYSTQADIEFALRCIRTAVDQCRAAR